MSQWFYQREGEEHGPFTWDELCFLARRGQLQPGDLVRQGGRGPWRAAEELPGLILAVRAPEPPPPLTPQQRSRVPGASSGLMEPLPVPELPDRPQQAPSDSVPSWFWTVSVALVALVVAVALCSLLLIPLEKRLFLRVVVPAVGGAAVLGSFAVALVASLSSSPRLIRWSLAALPALVLWPVSLAALAWIVPEQETAPQQDQTIGSTVLSAGGGSGLTTEQLALAAQTVLVVDPRRNAGGQGSAGVIAVKGQRLILITNRHVITGKRTFWRDFRAVVHFSTQEVRPVLRFRLAQDRRIDLAMLEVDAQGLRQGRDFVVLPFDDSLQYKVLDDVVAVGAPKGLPGTHTAGKISAIRDDTPFHIRLIQTDAAINPGNSGGPLFVKKNQRYFWIGVNTIKLTGEDVDNIGFALDARSALRISYTPWYPATLEGIRRAVSGP